MPVIKNHEELINKYGIPKRPDLIPESTKVLYDILDAVRDVPPVIDEEHYMRLKNAASFLGILDDSYEIDSACVQENVVPIGKSLTPKLRRRALDLHKRIRKTLNLHDAITKISNNHAAIPLLYQYNRELIRNGKIIEFVALNSQNSTHKSDNVTALNDAAIAATYTNEGKSKYPLLDPEVAQNIVSATKEYGNLFNNFVEIMKDNKSVKALSSQAAYSELSFESISDTTDDGASLLAYTNNQELIRQRLLVDSEVNKNFSKAKPEMLFVADYIVFGYQFRGQIIAWRRMNSAAGYVIKRIDVFNKTDVSFTVYNEDLENQNESVKVYVENYLLSFYDFNKATVKYFWDDTVERDKVYIYKITAFQNYFASSTNAFVSSTTPAVVSNATKQKIRALIEAVDPDDGKDTVSPYPFLAKVLLGDSNFDWILAGVNVRASVSRRDDRSVTRNLSYLNSQLDYIFQKMDEGKFLLPANLDAIITTINESIKQIGVIETLRDILKETGILFYFDGIDSDGELNNNKQSKFMDVLANSINVVTFLLNVNSFLTNYIKFLGNPGVVAVNNNTGISNNVRAGSVELENNLFDNTTDDQVKNINELIAGFKFEKTFDLTDVKGISKLIQLIRIVNDIGPQNSGVLTVNG